MVLIFFFGRSKTTESLILLGFGQQLINTQTTKKKAPFCNEALKGSLNLMVSKGPEETTGRDT